MQDLESLSAAAAALPVSKVTLWRWFRASPDIGVQIGKRIFVWREARMALAKGQSLAEASEIGSRCHASLH